jgi:hypothetical protein
MSDTSGWDTPNAPWHTRDHPGEGMLRIWYDHQTFVDYDENDVAASHVDNNLAGLSLEVYESVNIDDREIYFWYMGGQEFRPQLGSIDFGHNPCSRLLQMSNGLIAPASHDLVPMLNAMTTPRLAWIRHTLHSEASSLTGNQDALDAHFGSVAYRYGQLSYTDPGVIRQAAIFIDEPAY